MNEGTNIKLELEDILGEDIDAKIEIPIKLEAWLTCLDERMNEQQAQMKVILGALDALPSTVDVVEVAVTKLEPTRDDIIIFWMPSSLTHVQIQQIGASFDKVIAGRFRYIMLVRDSVKLEIITKSPGFLKVQ